MFPWIIWHRAVPVEEEKHTQKFNMSTTTLKCWNENLRFVGSFFFVFLQTLQFWLWPNQSIFDASDQEADFMKASDLSKFPLVRFRAALFFIESRGFLQAPLYWMLFPLNIHLIVDTYNYTRCFQRPFQLSRWDICMHCYMIYYFFQYFLVIVLKGVHYSTVLRSCWRASICKLFKVDAWSCNHFDIIL